MNYVILVVEAGQPKTAVEVETHAADRKICVGDIVVVRMNDVLEVPNATLNDPSFFAGRFRPRPES
jgi:hypothetical protein